MSSWADESEDPPGSPRGGGGYGGGGGPPRERPRLQVRSLILNKMSWYMYWRAKEILVSCCMMSTTGR